MAQSACASICAYGCTDVIFLKVALSRTTTNSHSWQLRAVGPIIAARKSEVMSSLAMGLSVKRRMLLLFRIASITFIVYSPLMRNTFSLKNRASPPREVSR